MSTLRFWKIQVLELRAMLLHKWKIWRVRKSFGNRGELAAIRFLQKRKYIIIGRQVRGLHGEIDIIAVEGRTIVFVEVKTRRSDQFEHPSEAVDARKQHRICQTALSYLKRHHLLEYAVRFDVIAVVWPRESKKPQIEHFQNAFESTQDFQLVG